MNVIYSENYNINLGVLNYLHPFDGMKFKKTHAYLKQDSNVNFIEPSSPASMNMIDDFLSSLMQRKVRDSVFIFRALEVPHIPFVSFSYLDRKILSPMRWGVSGTLLGAERALIDGGIYWNISGGYHHAMQQSMEGFCIYNDIGICHQQLIKNGMLGTNDKILIIDTDAHHGNGNAYTFMGNRKVTILDIYNAGIYPHFHYTRDRVDISVPISPGSNGKNYLHMYSEALQKLDDDYSLAFVVAGTDVLLGDKLGGLCLTIEDIVKREKLTLETLSKNYIPTVMLGGGGYSKNSAESVACAISACIESGIV